MPITDSPDFLIPYSLFLIFSFFPFSKSGCKVRVMVYR